MVGLSEGEHREYHHRPGGICFKETHANEKGDEGMQLLNYHEEVKVGLLRKRFGFHSGRG